MPDIKVASLFLSAARRDLQAIENMLDCKAFSAEIFGFHAQQTVEKALKAWLAFLDQEVPRTHNIRQLLVLLEKAEVDIGPLWGLVELTAFAVQFRYEAFEDLDEPINRPELLEEINHLVLQVEQHLQ